FHRFYSNLMPKSRQLKLNFSAFVCCAAAASSSSLVRGKSRWGQARTGLTAAHRVDNRRVIAGPFVCRCRMLALPVNIRCVDPSTTPQRLCPFGGKGPGLV